MIPTFNSKRTTLAGIFCAALGSVLLLCGAGSVPVENFAPQGPMQTNLNAGGHSITNAATVSGANVIANALATGTSGANLATGTVPNASLATTPLIPANNLSDVTNALTARQNIGGAFSQVIAKSANFTASTAGAIYNVTTGSSAITVTLPTASNGMFFAVRKADSGTGSVTVNGAYLGTQGHMEEVICDGTSFYNKLVAGGVDSSGNYTYTVPANANYNIQTSGTGSFQLNGNSANTVSGPVVLNNYGNIAIPGSSYLFASFTNNFQNLYLWYSQDCANWNLIGDGPAQYVPNGGTVRDPSMMQSRGVYWFVHTYGSFANVSYFCLAYSTDLVHVAALPNVSVAAIGGVTTTYAPEWFQDSDGSIHVLVAVSTNSGSTFSIYEMHPTTALVTTGAVTWSTPVQLTTSASAAIPYIDPFMIKIGSTYNLFATDPSAHTIKYLTSTSLTSGYTAQANPIGSDNLREGTDIVPLANGGYRMYTDTATTAGYVYYDSPSGLTGFTAGAPQTVTNYNSATLGGIRHGTILPVSGLPAIAIAPAANLLTTEASTLNANTFLSLQTFGSGTITIGDATGTYASDLGQVLIEGATNPNLRLGLMIDTTNNVGKIQAATHGVGPQSLQLNPAGGDVQVCGTTNGVFRVLPSTGSTNGTITFGSNSGANAINIYDGSVKFGMGATSNSELQFYVDGGSNSRFSWNGNGTFTSSDANEVMNLHTQSGNLVVTQGSITAHTGFIDSTSANHSALVKENSSGSLVAAVAGTDYPAVSATPVIIASGTVTFSSGTATITNGSITATSKLAGWSVNGTPSAHSSAFVPTAASGSMALKASDASDSDTINYAITN